MRIPIFQRAAETPWAITEDYLNTILEVAQRQNQSPEAVAAQLGRKLENTYEVEYRDGVAILEITGPLFRYANLFTELSGATSYEKVGQDFAAAVDNDSVSGIVLNIDSPGGEANGTNELAEMIYQARGRKPIIAYVGGMGASGAYWIASAADRIIADETAMLGSIGVRTALTDDSAKRERDGVRQYVIVSSQSPNKALDPSLSDDRSRVQRIVDDLGAVFVSKVARNRGITEDAVMANYGQGDVLVGNRAVSAGLADRLGSFEEALATIAQTEEQPVASGDTDNGGTMYLTAKTPATGEEHLYHEPTADAVRQLCPELATEIATQERERVVAILTCDEAKGRTELAHNLAAQPTVDLEQARKLLTAAPKTGMRNDAWLAEMDADDQGIGPDAGDYESNPEAIAASTIQLARDGGLIR